MAAVREIKFKYNDNDRYDFTLRIGGSATANRIITIPDANATIGGGDYVEYNAVVNQNSTNDPAATVKGTNGLVGTPLFTRDAEGEYSITLASGFPTNARTQIFHNQPGSAGVIRIYWNNANSLVMTQEALDGAATKIDTFSGLSLTIRVWNS